MLPNLASVLYDPECWETPQEFSPGHFLDKDGDFLVNEAFLLLCRYWAQHWIMGHG